MELLIALIVVLVICGLIYWAVHKLGAAFGVPSVIITVIDVVLVVVVVLYLLRVLLGPLPTLR